MHVQHSNRIFKKSNHWFGKLSWGMAATAISFVVAISSAFAGEVDFEQCRQLFANGNPPILQHPETLQLNALCFSAFAVLHSGNSQSITLAQITKILEAEGVPQGDRVAVFDNDRYMRTVAV
jgi:hypothetical protein